MTLGASRTPSLAELLQAAVQRGIEDIFVGLPGKVEKYDAATQTVDVLPMLRRPVVFDDGSESSDELPIIPTVPVLWPRGSGFFVSLPLEKGDLVWLVFGDRSLDLYKSSAGTKPIDPKDLRSNDLSDAVAIPGCYPLPKALRDGVANKAMLALGRDGGAQIHVTKDDQIEAENDSGAIVLSPLGEIAGVNQVGAFVLEAGGRFVVNGGNLEVLP